MKRSKFTDSQIIDSVKRVEAGIGVPDICRELGISTATFYKWRAKYGGMDVSMMSRMKELEDENRRLKKMYLRKLTQMVNKLKIETSISLRMRDEEVEIHGKSNCWDIGRR
jgi:putative transposase